MTVAMGYELLKEDEETALKRYARENEQLAAENMRLNAALAWRIEESRMLIRRNAKLRNHLRHERVEAYAEQHKDEADWFYDVNGDVSHDCPESVAEASDLAVGRIMQVIGSKEICVKYVADIAIAYDDDGDVAEAEFQVFDSQEDAEKAVAAMPKPPERAA